VVPESRKELLDRERHIAGERRRPRATDSAGVAARSSVVAIPEDVPQPPFWGARVVRNIPLGEVFQLLSETRLFRVSWGGANKRGVEWKQVREEFSERLERMKQEALEQGWLAPQAVYGYFPALSEGNDLLVFNPEAPDEVLVRLSFPRQTGDERLCLADYFLPVGSATRDVVAMQVVTVGPAATERFDTMDARNEYSEAYFSHGLAVQTAEAATELVFDRIRRELGLAQSRGVRFAWGFGALPDVEEHRKVFQVLPAERELGMTLTSAGQLVPEQSTATLLVHHKEVHYFKT
jgi:5-methyltetrahydrofolate--homocysteine methyltransferase